MKQKLELSGKYFFENRISDYGILHKRLDYYTLAKAFDAILNNDIMPILSKMGYDFELENGYIGYYIDAEDNYYTEEEYCENNITEAEYRNQEVYQYFIISYVGAKILKSYTNELVWYCEKLDMYIWGVTHFGTSWDYILTDIPCCTMEE